MPLRSIGRWKRDEEVQHCENCTTCFTLVHRRHHCRNCGGIFCAKCSSDSLVLPVVDGSKPQRVCKTCYSRCCDVARLPKDKEAIKEEVIEQAHISENAAGQTDSSRDPAVAPGTNSREPVGENAAENSDDDENTYCDNPIDVASRVASTNPVDGNYALSFLDALRDSLRDRDADNVLTVLLFAGAGKQQTMFLTVDNETIGDLAVRLAAPYFRLVNTPFKRATEEDLSLLASLLVFSNEHQTVEREAIVREVLTQCKRLVVSTLPFAQLQATLVGSTASVRSARSFLRSDRSDPPQGGTEEFE